MKVFIPGDAAACAVGADEVARNLERLAAGRGLAIQIVRNGSRGMHELEPLLEVETPHGRVGYARVAPGHGEVERCARRPDWQRGCSSDPRVRRWSRPGSGSPG